ncbi:D-alanyl-D-alanine carboxypeptidase/D-alanyl-D-alanine-endopeptidase [Bacillus sp. T3]|uniref:D-alanyl-D-alanine carboxypeptidase/D-alanyl-D-alanine endopeptidase n=1 Tax=Bacillus sp. T3 TaxID=467262 RepID=UPI00298281F1|nr:D-alanyl-D-alanine carboxypeptidase/D-alanyl-D-alanine-endopeptidase [Bacillus sp. T3]
MIQPLRKKILILSILIPLFAGSASATLHHVSGQTITEMGSQLDALLQQEPNLQGAIVGISIRSMTSGEVLYQQNGDVRLKPASNLKLLTGAAALSVLGENYRFKTELLKSGKVKKGKLNGNLYLKGKGDPTLLKEDIDEMAKKVREAGIKEISGHLIGDDTWYDDVRYSLDLPWSDEQTYYGTQISALTVSPDCDYDAGTIIVEMQSGNAIGQPGKISLTPPTNYVKINNQTVTISPDGKKELSYEREHGENTVTVKGTIPMKAAQEREWVGVWEPTNYAIELLNQALADNGVKVLGELKTGSTPKSAQLLSIHRSISLSELMGPFMKLSNNGIAEILIKEMGKVVKGEGSWEKGLEVLAERLEKFGLNPNTLVLRDGSGISHADLVPANEISKLLYAAQKEKWFPVFLNSLPVAGNTTKEIGGTLRKRMKSPQLAGKIKAKTGTISTVSSLSGYVETQSGETLIFSLLLNNLIDEEKGKAIEDKIVTLLAK